MKYIRTKDGIYVYDKAIQNIKSYWKNTLLSKYKINKYIKKEIEELIEQHKPHPISFYSVQKQYEVTKAPQNYCYIEGE